MDKGAINGGHVLLLPIEHFPSSLACSENAWAEMQRYLSALKACAASQVPFPPPPPLSTPHPRRGASGSSHALCCYLMLADDDLCGCLSMLPLCFAFAAFCVPPIRLPVLPCCSVWALCHIQTYAVVVLLGHLCFCWKKYWNAALTPAQ